jgi:hypothetical protein
MEKNNKHSNHPMDKDKRNCKVIEKLRLREEYCHAN